MKKYLLLTILVSSVAQAAPSTALDLLQLPPENRRIALHDASNDMFKKLSDIAFSDAQSMNVRWRALVSLAEISKEKSLPLLKKASESSKWFMRNAALVSLEESHPLQAEAVAKRLLKDKALVVRSAAVQVLKKYPSESNRELLWSEMDEKYNFRRDASLWIRSEIVQVLSEKPQSRELKIFARLLKDKDSRVGVAAIQGLEQLTGVNLNDGNGTEQKRLTAWRDYIVKEKIEL